MANKTQTMFYHQQRCRLCNSVNKYYHNPSSFDNSFYDYKRVVRKNAGLGSEFGMDSLKPLYCETCNKKTYQDLACIGQEEVKIKEESS